MGDVSGLQVNQAIELDSDGVIGDSSNPQRPASKTVLILLSKFAFEITKHLDPSIS